MPGDSVWVEFVEANLYPVHTIKTCLIKQSLMKPRLIKYYNIASKFV